MISLLLLPFRIAVALIELLVKAYLALLRASTRSRRPPARTRVLRGSAVVRDRLAAAKTWRQRVGVAPLLLVALVVRLVQYEIILPDGRVPTNMPVPWAGPTFLMPRYRTAA